MKKYFSLVLVYLFIISQVFAETTPTNNILQSGGGVNTTISGISIPSNNGGNLVWLHAGRGSTTAGNFYQLMAAKGGGGQYQVTTGKTFVAMGFWLTCDAVGLLIGFGYATSSFSDDTASASPPTGAVNYVNGASTTNNPFRCDTQSSWTYIPIGMSFPSGSYPFFRSSTTSAVRIAMVGVEI